MLRLRKFLEQQRRARAAQGIGLERLAQRAVVRTDAPITPIAAHVSHSNPLDGAADPRPELIKHLRHNSARLCDELPQLLDCRTLALRYLEATLLLGERLAAAHRDAI